MEKLRVNFKKMILYVNIALFVIFLIIAITIVGFSWEETDTVPTFLICGLYLVFAVGLSIFVPKTFKMEYDDKCFYYTRFGKEEVYEFKHVLYIDEPYTEKHKALCFYLNTGKLKFISFDRDKKILDVFVSHCKNAITREQFVGRFPNIKL
jgi:hypothetical protein